MTSTIEQYVLPILISSLFGVLATVITLIFNKRRAKAEVKKIDADSLKTLAEVDLTTGEAWKMIYAELNQRCKEFEARIDEINNRAVQEIKAREELEKKFDKIKEWFILNAKKLEEAGIEKPDI